MKKTTSQLYVVTFLLDAGLVCGIIAIPLFASQYLRATPAQVGTIFAISALVYILGCPLFGRLSDSWGRLGFMVSACFLFGVTYIGIAQAKVVWHMYAVIVFSGLSMAMFWPALEAKLAEGAGYAALRKRIGVFNVAWCGGAAIGSYMGGLLFDYSYRVPFYTAAIIGVIIGVYLWVHQRSAGAERPEVGRSQSVDDEINDTGQNKSLFLYLAWMANFGAWFTVGVMRSMFPLLGKHLGYSGSNIGLVFLAFSSAQVLIFFVLKGWGKWHYQLLPFFVAQSLTAIGALVVWKTSMYGGFLSASILMGVGSGFVYFSSIFYSLYGQEKAGSKTGLHESVLGIGVFLGPLLGGYVAEATHRLHSPFLLAAGVCLLVMVIQAVFLILHPTRRVVTIEE